MYKMLALMCMQFVSFRSIFRVHICCPIIKETQGTLKKLVKKLRVLKISNSYETVSIEARLKVLMKSVSPWQLNSVWCYWLGLP